MNPLFKLIITETAKRHLKSKKYTQKKYEKECKDVEVEYKHYVHDAFFILLGVIAATIGLKGFLLPNHFIDGGVMGISLITNELSGLSLSILIVAINAPFILMAYSSISRSFAARSILAIILLAISVHFLDFPVVTDDKLLIAVFGGFFLGAGIGLAIRGGAVIDGTEVLAVFVSRRTSLSIGDVILVFNIIIFLVGAYVFSIEIALYAMLTYLSASKTVDFVVSGIEEYVGVTIISDLHEEIRLAITEKLGRGCTIYSGKKGFTKEDGELKETNIVYTLLTRLEIAKLQTEIDKIDDKAFMVMHSIKDAKGGMIKKRPMKDH
jgi:uncharacterized membrane-anchored protein YitT (DUF2179 family)